MNSYGCQEGQSAGVCNERASPTDTLMACQKTKNGKPGRGKPRRVQPAGFLERSLSRKTKLQGNDNMKRTAVKNKSHRIFSKKRIPKPLVEPRRFFLRGGRQR